MEIVTLDLFFGLTDKSRLTEEEVKILKLQEVIKINEEKKNTKLETKFLNIREPINNVNTDLSSEFTTEDEEEKKKQKPDLSEDL